MATSPPGRDDGPPENLYREVEARLQPLALALDEAEPGDWLAEHPEPGQTFDEYLRAGPVRKSAALSAIYLCFIGDFTGPQQQILDLAGEYLGLFFDVPVRLARRLPLADIPGRARRTHPEW